MVAEVVAIAHRVQHGAICADTIFRGERLRFGKQPANDLGSGLHPRCNLLASALH
jgi:hypothetical protein